MGSGAPRINRLATMETANPDVLTVFCTCPDADAAAELATVLVESHLAACVNILPEVRSIFRWQGRTEDETETFIMVKTTQPRLAALVEEIQSRHPYDEPEIIALPVVGGSASYLQWVRSTSRIS